MLGQADLESRCAPSGTRARKAGLRDVLAHACRSRRRRGTDPAANLVDMTLELDKTFLLAHHLGRAKEAGTATPPRWSAWPS
jgi:hypothetical protein